MAEAIKQKRIMVQMYDREVVREYLKKYGGFIFSSTEVVRADSLENDLILKIDSERMPTKIFFNGQKVKLTKAN